MSPTLPSLCPFRLVPSFSEKIWGSNDLRPWFPPPGRKVGEVWFTDAANSTSIMDATGTRWRLGDLVHHFGSALLGTAVTCGSFPLLVKLLFPTEKLSVQVHPGDAWAAQHEGSLGKTEMWHVLRALPGACVAAGFQSQFTRDDVQRAALDGTIESMLQWWPVQEGDTIYIPAGTVHAIGPGLVLCEIQQSSDLTYRLYDYGRPRELHLEKSLAVANLGPHPGLSRSRHLGHGRSLLVQSPYFRTERIELQAGSALELAPNSQRFEIWIVLSGSAQWQQAVLAAGDVVVLPATGESFRLQVSTNLVLLRTFPPV